MVVWLDGWMNGWTDERIDGLAIQQRPKCNNILFSFSVIFGRVRVETPSLKFSGFCFEPKKRKGDCYYNLNNREGERERDEKTTIIKRYYTEKM